MRKLFLRLRTWNSGRKKLTCLIDSFTAGTAAIATSWRTSSVITFSASFSISTLFFSRSTGDSFVAISDAGLTPFAWDWRNVARM